MSVTIDLEPAAGRLAAVISAVRDDQLSAPTPCSMSTLGDLVDHAGSFSVAFTAAARKDRSISGSGTADASRLGGKWRSRIPQQLAELAAAWKDPAAWEGLTAAGGLDLPAAMAGRIALDEIVLHGWDIARASGLDWDPPDDELRACLELIPTISPPARRSGDDGLFGPAVEVAADAPLLDRVLGLSGRDPAWSPTGSATRAQR